MKDPVENKLKIKLFTNQSVTSIPSALPIWGASSVLTQRGDLLWLADVEGKLCYTAPENDQAAVNFWVTEDLEREFPTALADTAALNVIDTFDIRAACLHLIYAASATKLDKPWEQEFEIDDRQIEEYLGLKKRTDKNRQQKLALIKEIAQQPCKITTYVSWKKQGKKKGFIVEEGRLWHLLGTRYHYEQDLLGGKELVGITFTLRAGLWAKYFLNKENRPDIYNQATLSKLLLENVTSVWQHHEGAARLMIWLLFKADFQQLLVVQDLMTIAYGGQKIVGAKQERQLRKKLSNCWDEDLLVLQERGWHVQFHDKTYPHQIRPLGWGRSDDSRPRGFFNRLLLGQIWISPPTFDKSGAIASVNKAPELITLEETIATQEQPKFDGCLVKNLRMQKGWSQRKLARLTGISQGLISLIENNERSITCENQEIIRKVLESMT